MIAQVRKAGNAIFLVLTWSRPQIELFAHGSDASHGVGQISNVASNLLHSSFRKTPRRSDEYRNTSVGTRLGVRSSLRDNRLPNYVKITLLRVPQTYFT